MTNIWDREIVGNPNWEDHIQFFFTQGDITCMSGMQLDRFERVRFFARRIYGVTEAGTMPKGAPERRWNAFRLGTFYNWIKNGSPRTAQDESVLENFRVDLNTGGDLRTRKNLSSIDPSSEEMDKLKAAFEGIMSRAPGEPNSYFDVAGLHWYPYPATYCVHGEDLYNPWHRVYLLAFENALRSVPGCEDVTLPYWDIGSGAVPDVLFEGPFNQYQFPQDVPGRPGTVAATKGATTKRFSKPDIEAQLNSPFSSVNRNIDLALGAKTWLSFNGLPPYSNNIIQAHDSGHGICGPTLATTDLASFDPLFWFFHCNWDRLWWEWQRNAGVQRLSDFRNLMVQTSEEAKWLDDPISGLLVPFGVLSDVTIDSVELGVDYELPPLAESASSFELWTTERSAVAKAAMAPTPKVMVRLEGLDRLTIAGSVALDLFAGDEMVGSNFIFQSTAPEDCPTCREKAKVNIDFEVERTALEGREISIVVSRVDSNGSRSVISLEEVGSPTVSVRLPLETPTQ